MSVALENKETTIFARDGVANLELIAPNLVTALLDGEYLREFIENAATVKANTALQTDIFSMSARYPLFSDRYYKRIDIRCLQNVSRGEEHPYDELQLMMYDMPQPFAPNHGKTLFISWEGAVGSALDQMYVHFVDSGVDFHVRPNVGVTAGNAKRRQDAPNVTPWKVPNKDILTVSYTGWPTTNHRGELLLPTMLQNPA